MTARADVTGGIEAAPHTLGVSVIMTVRNDPDGTRETLDSLLAQSRSPDEIVIVDGGSTDETRAVLARYTRDYAHVRVIQAPGANIARGRNLAAASAKHVILAVTDAGCRARSNWLAELLRPFEVDPATEFVAGVYAIAPRSRFERVVGLATMRGQLEPFQPETFNPSARSLALRKDLWSRVGGWPEWLDFSEDTWFDHRVRKLGAEWRFREQAVVDWRPRTTWRGLAKQFFGYGTGRGMTGIDAASFRYNLRNLGIVLALAAAAAVKPMLIVPLILAIGYVHVWTFHAKASAVARHLQDGSTYPLTIAVMNVVLFSHLAGFVVGRCRRRGRPREAGSRDPTCARRDAPLPSERKQERRWLCIAHAFPPIHRSGTQRTLGFVRHLDSLGWRASVLTVTPNAEAVDPGLLALVPNTTTVHRCDCPMLLDALARLRLLWYCLLGRARQTRDIDRSAAPTAGDNRGDVEPVDRSTAARYDLGRNTIASSCARGVVRRMRRLADWFTWLLVTPDARIGWLVPGVLEGMRAIRRHRPEVIFSTSPSMTAHLIACALAILYRIPWVADFRDPWRGNPFRTLPYGSINRWDAWLERLVLSRSDHVTCTSPTTVDLLVARHPAAAARSTVIYNGFDAESVRHVVSRRDHSSGTFLIVHAGDFYGPRSPHALLAAVRVCLRRRPDLADRVRVDLIGAPTFGGRTLRSLADDLGLGSIVRVLGRRPHEETLARVAGADAVALVAASGTGADLQIPAKLFEYLALRRPVLTLASSTGPIVDILRRARALAETSDPDDVAVIADAIERLVDRRAAAADDAWSGVDAFERGHRAKEMIEVFERVTQGRRRIHTFHAYADRTGEHTAKRGDVLMDRGLETVEEKRVRSSLATDGRFGSVAGEHSCLVGQGQ